MARKQRLTPEQRRRMRLVARLTRYETWFATSRAKVRALAWNLQGFGPRRAKALARLHRESARTRRYAELARSLTRQMEQPGMGGH